MMPAHPPPLALVPATTSFLCSALQTRFVGLMQYDGDLKLPTNYLVPPPAISGTSGKAKAVEGVPPASAARPQCPLHPHPPGVACLRAARY